MFGRTRALKSKYENFVIGWTAAYCEVGMSNRDSDICDLVKLALKAKDASYSPYSNFKVGAALKTIDGSIFTGCNVEVVTMCGTICAERTAIVKAVSQGYRHFTDIAISRYIIQFYFELSDRLGIQLDAACVAYFISNLQ